MTPQARVQAAIELLDEVIESARTGGAAADTLIARYFKTRRYAGSKDRRAVREHVYAAIRRAGEIPESGRSAMVGLARVDSDLAALFDGSPHGPALLHDDDETASAGIAPEWLVQKLAETVPTEDMPALLERAPLDLRVNRLKGNRANLLDAFPGARPTPHAPDGLRLREAIQVESSPAWIDGLVEVQDEGSQLAALATGAAAGMTVVDLCAGAGGKTLALAAMMGDRGHLVACDTDRGRLSRLGPRATRAGATAIDTRLLDPGREAGQLQDLLDLADVVLIDAPCSGTGTWRRNPETRWRISQKRLQQLGALQSRLLDVGAALVRPGGTLVYVVCSLLAEEGREQIANYLAANDAWTAEAVDLVAGRESGDGWVLSPARDGTDGFFIARLKRSC